MVLLEIRNVTKRFGGLKALDNVSFNINSGEIVGLIGPNGSGKSTLINVITGFYKPTSGEVLLKGKDVTGLKSHATAKTGLAGAFSSPRFSKSFPFSTPCAWRFTSDQASDSWELY